MRSSCECGSGKHDGTGTGKGDDVSRRPGTVWWPIRAGPTVFVFPDSINQCVNGTLELILIDID